MVDSRNHVWFCEFTGDKIGRLDPATGAITEYAPPTRYSGPRRLALDRNGNVWFTQYNTNKIALLDRDTGAIREWEIPTPDPKKLLPRLLTATEAAALEYNQVHVRRATLEDVFLHLTGRSLRE